MRLQHQWGSVLVAAILSGLVGVMAGEAAGKQFIPMLSVREGALRDVQTMTDGFIAYLTLLNARDGGINGGECYERLKGKGPTGAAAFLSLGTPIAYALTERATQDQLPLLTPGIGRADAADGRVFPYVFPAPSTWWSQNTAKLRFIGQRVGGMDKLKGLKIVHVYHDSDMGRETIPLLDAQATQYGFAVQHLAVKPLGLDQKATWLRVQVAQPDWVILRAQGVLIAPALKAAAQIGFPRDKMVEPFSTCGEQEIVAAGEAAIGFICGTWYGTGAHFPLIQEMRQYVYARGKGAGPESDVGTTHWNRGVLRAVLITEAIRTAMHHFGHQPLTGAQVQWGLEHLTLTPAYLKEMGAEGLIPPLTLSCRDHEGGGGVQFQQWHAITDWIAPDQVLVRPLVEASAAKYAQDKGIAPRDCP